jgi:hypothetical protein
MTKHYLGGGKITSTHGVLGGGQNRAVDEQPEIQCSFKTLYLDGTPMKFFLQEPNIGCHNIV